MVIFKFSKSLIVLAFLVCTSCLTNNSNSGSGGIRIVDLNGNPRDIQRYIPEGNAQILSTQNININQPANKGVPIVTPAQNLEMPVTQNIVAQMAINPVVPKQTTTVQPFEENIESQEDVSFDLSQENVKEVVVTTKAIPKSTTAKNKKFKFVASKVKKETVKKNQVSNKYFIQIGAFSSLSNANKSLTNAKKVLKGNIKTVKKNSRSIHYVLLGPVSKNSSKITLKKVKEFGYKDAFIVK
jgi:cell division septation protein DedD